MAEIAKQAYKDIQACIQPQICTHTKLHTHTLIPKESVRCDSERWGATERKILYRWRVKNKMEQITAWKPHTYTHIWCIDGYGNEWHQFSRGNGERVGALRPISLHYPLSLNPHFHTFYYFLPHQLWLLTPSQASLLLVFLPLLSKSITLAGAQYFFWHVDFSFFFSLSVFCLSTFLCLSLTCCSCPFLPQWSVG